MGGWRRCHVLQCAGSPIFSQMSCAAAPHCPQHAGGSSGGRQWVGGSAGAGLCGGSGKVSSAGHQSFGSGRTIRRVLWTQHLGYSSSRGAMCLPTRMPQQQGASAASAAAAVAAEKCSRRLLAAPLLTGGKAGGPAGNCGVCLPCELRVSLSLQGFLPPSFQHVLRPKDFGGMRQIPTIFSVSWA